MDVLVVQHTTTGEPGALAEALESCGLRLDTRDVEAGAGLPEDDGSHAGLVVLGGVMNAHEDASYPHLAATAGLIRRFHHTGKPVLGICLGAQLIARACGGRAYRHDAPEQGFVALALTAAATQDVLLSNLTSPQWIFQWHNDTYDLPADARLLMTGRACRNQAFHLGAATYGFQCHFEVTRRLLPLWLAESRASGYHLAHADFFARIENETAMHIDAGLQFCGTICTRWAGLVAANCDN